MEAGRIPLNRYTWDSIVNSIKRFAGSPEAGTKAKVLFTLLILFLCSINGLNVVSSYVGRDFMTAIADRNRMEFVRQALLYVLVFAASTIVSVIYRYTEERLGLLWRVWATRKTILHYGNHRVYYRLKLKGEVGNPDQRIADDLRAYVTMTISFVLMLLNGSFTVIAFSGVLWSISPQLFIVAVLYAAAGTYLTFIFGRPLVRLNYDQSDKEANFRSSLTYLRANAESMALSRREGHLIQLSLRNLGDLAANFRRIISINRNVNFFTTGYNWLIQIIPALIVAPLFIEGKVEFGVITQSAIAFTQLLGAFSLIVTQFQSISSYTAVLARLSALAEASSREKAAESSANAFPKDEGLVSYLGLTLRSPRSDRILIKGLSVDIPRGRRVLVRGQDKTAKTALFYATAGLWELNEGRLVRPRLDQIVFMTELPYLPPGTLRELLLKPWPDGNVLNEHTVKVIQVSEERIMETLRALRIETLVTGFGGLDKRQYWENILPMADQQLLVVARVLLTNPRFVFLDKPGTALHPEQLEQIFSLFVERSITYVTFDHEENGAHLEQYDMVLNLEHEGAWSYRPIIAGKVYEEIQAAFM